MFFQDDSTDEENCYKTPNKKIEADFNYPRSVTDRVLASITKPPRPIIKSFRGRSSSFLSEISEDESNMTTYSTFKSGYKLVSSIIEESHSLGSQILDDKDIAEYATDHYINKGKQGCKKKIEQYQERVINRHFRKSLNQKESFLLLKFFSGKKIRKYKRGKKSPAPAKQVYGSSLLEFLKELGDPVNQVKLRKEQKRMLAVEEQEMAELSKMIMYCEELSYLYRKQIMKISTSDAEDE